MGKKAKKRKEGKLPNIRPETRGLEPNEFEGQLMAYVEDENWEMLFMDPSQPIWVFSNESTKEISTIGAREACLRASEVFTKAARYEYMAQGFGGGLD